MSDLGGNALDWIDNNNELLIEVSDKIWDFAELGFVEFKSSKLLLDVLKDYGFTVEAGVADIPTAFVASYGSGKPIIGIMGEYDALPGLSQQVVPFKKPIEEGAPGHGCGHNIHGTSGLGGALAAKSAFDKGDLKGTIRYFGCPAEEMLSGKAWMVKEGVFENVDACISHHPSVMNLAPVRSSNANNAVKFHFRGKSSHAAGSPEQGRSALDAVELMNMGVNFLREHIIQDARIHYVIEEGGGQPNVVPDYASSWYLIRAPERDQLETIYERVLKIAKGAAMMTETDLEIQFIKGVYNKLPNKVLGDIITENMRKIRTPIYNTEEIDFAKKIAETVSSDEKRNSLRNSKRPKWEELLDILIDNTIPEDWTEGLTSHGSTDVADVSWNTPTMEFNTATYVLGTPGHSWQNVALSGMSIGHKSLIFASKVIALTVLDLLTKSPLLEKTVKEFQLRKGDRHFKSPIPNGIQPPLNQWLSN